MVSFLPLPQDAGSRGTQKEDPAWGSPACFSTRAPLPWRFSPRDEEGPASRTQPWGTCSAYLGVAVDAGRRGWDLDLGFQGDRNWEDVCARGGGRDPGKTDPGETEPISPMGGTLPAVH